MEQIITTFQCAWTINILPPNQNPRNFYEAGAKNAKNKKENLPKMRISPRAKRRGRYVNNNIPLI